MCKYRNLVHKTRSTCNGADPSCCFVPQIEASRSNFAFNLLSTTSDSVNSLSGPLATSQIDYTFSKNDTSCKSGSFNLFSVQFLLCFVARHVSSFISAPNNHFKSSESSKHFNFKFILFCLLLLLPIATNALDTSKSIGEHLEDQLLVKADSEKAKRQVDGREKDVDPPIHQKSASSSSQSDQPNKKSSESQENSKPANKKDSKSSESHKKSSEQLNPEPAQKKQSIEDSSHQSKKEVDPKKEKQTDDDEPVIPALTLEEFQQKQKEEQEAKKRIASREPKETNESDKQSTTPPSTTTVTNNEKSATSTDRAKQEEVVEATTKTTSESKETKKSPVVVSDDSDSSPSRSRNSTQTPTAEKQNEEPQEGENCPPADHAAEQLNCSANSTDQMLVIEKSAIELIPLQSLLSAMLAALAATFMVVGGAIPYVFQYAEIYKRKSALGFSLLVCLALCVANILRIMFWFGKRFETVLLVQSIVMITAMLVMLEISVRMNKKMTPPSQRTSIWKGDIIGAFWKWNDLTSYIAALLAFTLVAGVITYFFTRFPIYVETLGMVSLLVEACLGLPQLIRNFQRKSTQGMSINMVLMWLLGDVGKTIYFVVKQTPAQFWICSSLQITIDVLILGQVYFYNRGSSRIPTYIPSQSTKTAA